VVHAVLNRSMIAAAGSARNGLAPVMPARARRSAGRYGASPGARWCPGGCAWRRVRHGGVEDFLVASGDGGRAADLVGYFCGSRSFSGP
jgi:hypothetical protein